MPGMAPYCGTPVDPYGAAIPMPVGAGAYIGRPAAAAAAAAAIGTPAAAPLLFWDADDDDGTKPKLADNAANDAFAASSLLLSPGGAENTDDMASAGLDGAADAAKNENPEVSEPVAGPGALTAEAGVIAPGYDGVRGAAPPCTNGVLSSASKTENDDVLVGTGAGGGTATDGTIVGADADAPMSKKSKAELAPPVGCIAGAAGGAIGEAMLLPTARPSNIDRPPPGAAATGAGLAWFTCISPKKLFVVVVVGVDVNCATGGAMYDAGTGLLLPVTGVGSSKSSKSDVTPPAAMG